MNCLIVKRADGRPAHEVAKPRLRQSEVDARRAWKLAEVREAQERRA